MCLLAAWCCVHVSSPQGALTPCHSSFPSNLHQGTAFTRASKADHFLEKLFKYAPRELPQIKISTFPSKGTTSGCCPRSGLQSREHEGRTPVCSPARRIQVPCITLASRRGLCWRTGWASFVLVFLSHP